jgi:hypothetical protein
LEVEGAKTPTEYNEPQEIKYNFEGYVVEDEHGISYKLKMNWYILMH